MKGQIVKIISNLYTVSSDNKLYECRARGKIRFDKLTPLVGDKVIFDEKDTAINCVLSPSSDKKTNINDMKIGDIYSI